MMQFLFTLPLGGYIILCFSKLNGRQKIATGIRYFAITWQPVYVPALAFSAHGIIWGVLYEPAWDWQRQTAIKAAILEVAVVNLTENEFIFSFAFSDLPKTLWELHQDGCVNMITVSLLLEKVSYV